MLSPMKNSLREVLVSCSRSDILKFTRNFCFVFKSFDAPRFDENFFAGLQVLIDFDFPRFDEIYFLTLVLMSFGS